MQGLDWELVVVDNGSTDETTKVIAAACDALPIVPLAQPIAGKNRALNMALDHARGHVLLFTDDDVIVSPKWLKEHLAAAQRWPDDMIFGGPVSPRFPPDTPYWMVDPDFPFSVMAFARYQHDQEEGPIENPPFGPNVAFRASIFQAHRFNEAVGPDGTQSYRMGSETELLSRLAAKGHRFIYLPNAFVEHVITADQTNIAWLVRRAARDGRQAAAIASAFDGPKIMDVPRYLWRRLLGDAINAAGAVFAPAGTRCVRVMCLAKTWAMIREIRRSRRPSSVR